jgi:2-amino-1-hydroxyethylphosphonate dioxygenase (glycine-forming)
MIRNADAVAEEIFELYAENGASEYAGEKVSQLEHMCQAAELAMKEGFDDEVVLAAFLHDIGHLLPVHDESESMNGYGVMDHERAGADYLRNIGFSDRLCRLVASHVDAKRYLTCRFPDYYKQLSVASKKTLEYQGGRMSEEEAFAFESDPLFELYIKMRRWDEAAKIEGRALPDIALFRKKMIIHLEQQMG